MADLEDEAGVYLAVFGLALYWIARTGPRRLKARLEPPVDSVALR